MHACDFHVPGEADLSTQIMQLDNHYQKAVLELTW